MVTAEILSQGDEVVTGQTVDTNAAWLAERLTELGVDVVRHTTVGDRLADIEGAFRDAVTRAHVVLCTGGLGPTEDDLTAQACATAFGLPLLLDEEAMRWIEALYARMGRTMAASNRKQALLPTGAQRLDNHQGTAPGFAFEAGRAIVACMPGVPREMRAMFDATVVPLLAERFQLVPGRLIVLRTTGAGESELQDRIGPFTHPDAVLAYRTSLGENQIKLRVRAGANAGVVQALVDELATRIGTPVFTIEGLDAPGGALPEVVGRMLLAQGHTLATAESCTGGRIASMCTAVPGASAWFQEGVVAYANATKTRLLGVSEALLSTHGAVSEPVARAMAEGVRVAAGTSFGLATTGIAGPDGGTPDKPVGTVHIALATPHLILHRQLRLSGDRHRIQVLSAHAALDLLRRHLQGILPSAS